MMAIKKSLMRSFASSPARCAFLILPEIIRCAKTPLAPRYASGAATTSALPAEGLARPSHQKNAGASADMPDILHAIRHGRWTAGKSRRQWRGHVVMLDVYWHDCQHCALHVGPFYVCVSY